MIHALAASLIVLAAADAKPAATEALYRKHCQSCHMADGNSPLEPLNFTDGTWKHGSDLVKVEKVIAKGAPGSAMLPFGSKLKPAEVRALAEHVRAFDKTLKPAKAAPKQ